ncbi:hypothetical protein CAPTEDRAFT_182259 [Capitella teleta]|uniref:Cadherin domain-containing protein n=1 Tax=Capitella teleta TaxID=283909 RepID=R7TTD2_CAPTE|nr:hypothetical protein CAPTEDRAFT_182259 [Capitella teleta]|eukprot:ELT94275.1 hypothetical protein CAPTEDRAFT_182259 [Capitella teleta]
MAKSLGALLILSALFVAAAGQDSTIKYQISEGVAIRTVIGDVAVDSGVIGEYPPSTLQEISYILLDQNGAFISSHPYLSINRDTGILSTSSEIDREAFCPGRAVCEINVDVATSSANYFHVIGITLTIIDVNDNAPDFGQATAFIDIPESALVGSGFPLPLASDPDGSEFGITSYNIESRLAVPFEIQVIPNIQDPLSLELVVTEQLDRERIPDYEFTVIAKDGGNPAKRASMRVNVTVTDINDNHPEFKLNKYQSRIKENSDVPKTLVTVEATDADTGPNGRITYELASSTRQNYGNIFQLNEDSGILTLLQALDRELKDEYILTVTARDRGAGSRLATTTVEITVTDANDNSPVVNVNSMAEDGQPVVLEGSDPGVFVALVSVVDPDLGRNGAVNCLLDSSHFDIQPLQKRKYKIVSASTFDREIQDVYNVTLSCHDNGVPRQVTESVISIKVADINDHAPVFSQLLYEAEVKENVSPGLFVTQVTALDGDTGKNAEVSYELYGQLSHLFSVDAETGKITTQSELDHESFSDLTIHVVATDHGEPALSSNAEIKIKIIDVNDEAPIFTQESYTFVVVENKPRDFELGRIEAFDRDASPFNHITYSMTDFANQSSTMNVFNLEEASGVLTTKVSLDRETTSVYFMSVTAGNHGYPELTGTATVTIFVADDNDNAPVLDFPNTENYTVTISSHTNEGDAVTQLRSHDLDTGNNAAISYELRAYDEDQWDSFIVDSLSGLVYTNKDMSYLTEVTRIRLKVLATDHGTVTLDAQGDLEIILDPSIKVIPNIPHDYSDLGGAYDTRDDDGDNNLLVIIVVVAISGVLITILLVAIVFVLIRSRRNHRQERNGIKPGTSAMVAKSPSISNKYIVEDVEWVKGDPENGSLSDGKVFYKKPLKQTNTKAGRNSPAVEDWEKNVLKNNFRESPQPAAAILSPSHIPTTRGHELGISYVPPVAQPYGSAKRKRSNDKRMAELRRLQLATPSGDDPVLDLDSSSASSGDMSNADSGRGPSEEGEMVPPPLPRQDYKPMLTLKKSQGSSYPRLSSFQSPAQSPRTHDPPSLDIVRDDSSQNGDRQTEHDVTARSKKGDNESYSILSNMLSKAEDKPPGDFNFNNSDSLLKYKGQGPHPARVRRSSGTPSDMTDMTASTTSGSYMIPTDVDDLGSHRNLREVDV